MTPFELYRNAIANIESRGSGGYTARGPVHKTMGQALGRYQIMEANLPGWSKAALGRVVSKQEFMKDPKIQDRIFDHRFGSYVQKYGPSGAASMWFTGRPNAPNAKDALGTSGANYVAMFNKHLAAAGQAPLPMAAAAPTGIDIPTQQVAGQLAANQSAAQPQTEVDPFGSFLGLMQLMKPQQAPAVTVKQDATEPQHGAPQQPVDQRMELALTSHTPNVYLNRLRRRMV